MRLLRARRLSNRTSRKCRTTCSRATLQSSSGWVAPYKLVSRASNRCDFSESSRGDERSGSCRIKAAREVSIKRFRALAFAELIQPVRQHARAGTPPGGLHWSHGEATERLGNRESM